MTARHWQEKSRSFEAQLEIARELAKGTHAEIATLLARAEAAEAEVARLRAIPRMPTRGQHYDPETGTCSYCHGVGACPECWGRVGLDRMEAEHKAAWNEPCAKCGGTRRQHRGHAMCSAFRPVRVGWEGEP